MKDVLSIPWISLPGSWQIRQLLDERRVPGFVLRRSRIDATIVARPTPTTAFGGREIRSIDAGAIRDHAGEHPRDVAASLRAPTCA
jgi:hypothetical protein